MKHEKITEEFISFLDHDENLKKLVEKNLALAKENNPDKTTNPAQTLNELYAYLDWSVKCMPWEVLKNKQYQSLYLAIDQATGYFWYIFDQPLEELKGLGYYYPSLQYHEPIASWIKKYSKTWGEFLSKKESWNEDYYQLALQDDLFGLTKGWYGNKNIWTSFNDFFSRKLIDNCQRPLADCDVISPADSTPQGFFKIDKNSNLINPQILKSSKLSSVKDLIGEDSAYCNSFAGGTLTHTFLNIFDYHRYHFPVDGVIKEIRKISGANAGGGITEWDGKNNRYVYYNEMGFQMIETRDCVIVETDDYGLVAILPIGMSQICSCNWEKNLKVGARVQKGDPMGFFQFGGSDVVMIFQSHISVKPLVTKNNEGYNHILMGDAYAKLSNNLVKKKPI